MPRDTNRLRTRYGAVLAIRFSAAGRSKLIENAVGGDRQAIQAIRKQLDKIGENQKLLDDLLNAKDPKNYVIFDHKNIEIMEGPGKNALFKPGYPKGK